MNINDKKRQMLINFLNDNLGTTNLEEAKSYLEDPLRMYTLNYEPTRVSVRIV